ncbi:MAG: tRNA lysidine(34) synthetase TilS, partial [Candidatus Tectomicrobia bacterium]|nr:tRNA lysidine(34) synthetase TilS [Candidatus Tectomicrobia bacterium]
WQGPWRLQIYRKAFTSLPVAIQRRIVRHALETMHVAHLMSFRHIESLRHFLAAGRMGQRHCLPGELFAEHLVDKILLWNASQLAAVPCLSTLPVPGVLDLGPLNSRLTADIIDTSPQMHKRRPQEGYVALDRLYLPLRVRFWQRGDRFYPLGAVGSKKLQDFFVDSKIPRGERPYIPLILSDDHIVWVSGHRIAEPFKICAATKRVVRLRYCSMQADRV